MNTPTNGLDKYADNTKNVIDTASDKAKDAVDKAHNRLTDVFAAAKDTAERVQKKAVAGAKVADKAVREHPYQALGIAFGVGALVGFLLSRRGD